MIMMSILEVERSAEDNDDYIGVEVERSAEDNDDYTEGREVS